MNADVTRKERRLVRWYYVMGPLPRRGLTCILIVMGEFLLLSMLDDLVFHNTGLYLVGLFTALAIVIVFTVATSYAMLASSCDLNKKTWSSVAAKAEAARREDPSREKPEAPFTAREDRSGLLQAAWEVAEPLGISLPDHRRFLRRMLAVALVLLAAVYVPHYVSRAQTMRQEMEAAAQTTRALEASFADAGLDPFCIDPTKEHDKVSYYVTGDVVDETGEETGSSVRVDVDNDGRVIETGYHLAVDPALSQEENLAQAEKDLAPELTLDILAEVAYPVVVEADCSGELCRKTVLRIRETDHVKETVDPFLDIAVSHLLIPQSVSYILIRGQIREQCIGLKHDTEISSGRRKVRHIPVSDIDPALRRSVQTRNETEQR